MPKYALYARFSGSQYLGEVEAASREEAIELGHEHPDVGVSLCHQCTDDFELGDPSCPDEIVAEKV